jgi:ATP-dependent Clp protease ATP-binding subunit ClpC
MSALPKFDNRAKNALAVAQQIAIQLGHHYIGSEHLLFGILSQPQEGLPFQMSFVENISNQELLEIIRKQGLDRFQNQNTQKDDTMLLPEITDELQSCLDYAISIAEKNNYNYIGIEHLIYGILQTEHSNGQKIMNLTPEGSTKLQSVLASIFASYSQGIKTDDTKYSKQRANKKQNSVLDFFSTNLNSKVSSEQGFEVIERESEINRMIQILSRKNKNNPILLGEPGVGKTALVEGLAKRINQGKVPEWLQHKRILSLDVGGLLAGSIFRGEFEQRIKMIIEEVVESGDIILFIDELHTVVGAGSGSHQGPDLSNILKPALARGEMSVIGATTEDEFRTVIKKDKAFERRFQPIRLEEPDQKQTVDILRGTKSLYENYHRVIFPEEMLPRLVELCGRFLPDRFFPDKAIDVLDECLVRTKIQTSVEHQQTKTQEQEWVEIEKQILDLIRHKNEAILNNDTELTQKIAAQQQALETGLSDLNSHTRNEKLESIVTIDVLDKVISEMSGVPLVRISSNVFTQIKSLQDSLDKQIFGQTEATLEIGSALKRSYSGVNPHKGPIASFLLLGPTGVGKTELVKVLTQELYGDPTKYLLKLDMSEFKEKHQMSRLLGAPAGYVGYEDAPQLTEFLRKKPYSVILFDEIEKGHPENLNILLQMLEDGKVTDAKGQTVSCEHALIFMTSNLGKNQLNKFASKIGFVDLGQQIEADYESLKEQVMHEVERNVKPEIIGRITAKIVFRPISKTMLKQIVYKELGILQSHLLTQNRRISFKELVVDFVIEQANDKLEYGAREVKSLIARLVQDPMSEFILDNPGLYDIEVTIKQGKVTVVSKKISTKKLDTAKVSDSIV